MSARGFSIRPVLPGLLFAAVLQAQAGIAMSDRPSAEELEARIRSERSPLTGTNQPADGETRAKSPATENLLATSQILAANGSWTLVPKGSVLIVPAKFTAYVVDRPTGSMVSWQEFLVANRSWLGQADISMEQAAGKEPIKPDAAEQLSRQNKVIIATHRGGAISCKATLPPQP